jgi:copper chaperone
MKTTRLKVDGMSCGHCRETVEKTLRNQTGVRSATVDLDAATAEVEYEEREVAPEQLIAAVTAEGYPAAFAGDGAGGAP